MEMASHPALRFPSLEDEAEGWVLLSTQTSGPGVCIPAPCKVEPREESEVMPGCPHGPLAAQHVWSHRVAALEVGQLREEIQTDTGLGPVLSDEVLDPPPSPFLAQNPLTLELEQDTALWFRL